PSVPAPRIASASGAAQGGPAPAPIASIKTGSSGGGGSRSPVPIMAGGGSSGSKHGGGSPGPAPAPSKAGSGSGGGSSGPSLAVAPSVPAPRGGGSGQGVKGNPEKDGEGRPSLAAEKDIDFGPYMADLQRRIKRAWFPPKGNESKRVMVVFKVHRNGTMSNLRLARSSGLAIADQAALKAVTNAAPFRPLPAGAPDDVDIQFTFDYNVFKSGRSAGTFRRF
ncbi:MAG: TonB C-terminal domain-containing protein, partial [Cyanobacteria bacterium HKST-UBA01]|nr:TonB C-terminal domain-containing protein [Cyanobacteria bacterium HKST-UBA01]